MSNLFLQYGTYTAGSITWSATQEFELTKDIPIVNTSRQKSKDLRDIPFNHLISSRSGSRKITINAKELLDSAVWTWLVAFYNADCWQYNENDANWSTEAVRVDLAEAGDMPMEFLANNKMLKKITLTLNQFYPDS